MSHPPQHHRTRAFHEKDTETGQKVLVFWTFDLWPTSGMGTVHLNHIAESFRYITPLTQDLSPREGMGVLEQLQAQAEATLKPADDRAYEIFKRLGDDYHRAAPFREHPVYVQDARLNALKQQARPDLKLKPRKAGDRKP